MDWTISQAEGRDSEELTRIAISAKSYWGYPERWIKVWLSELTIKVETNTNRLIYKACQDNETLGFYVQEMHETLASLDHLWVKPEVIRRGVGRTLWEHAAALAVSRGADRMEVISDPNATGFYQRMGMIPISEVVYTLDGTQRRLPRLAIDL